ncbi:hypothetical protein JTB14_011950 [Gonioctena quinquepunctata]|nr:hypothetical protein JTB14_011950 [Gonioctena quinquepunctata]
MEYSKKDDSTKCAPLLHYIEEEANLFFTTFKFVHFIPFKNLDFERYKFFTWKQFDGESIDNVTDLENKTLSCELGNLMDGILKSIFICRLVKKDIGQRLLEGDCKSLQEAVNKAKAIKNSQQQREAISKFPDKQKPSSISAS